MFSNTLGFSQQKNGTTAAIQYISLPSTKFHEYSALNAARSSIRTFYPIHTPRSLVEHSLQPSPGLPPMFASTIGTMTPWNMDDDGIPIFATSSINEKGSFGNPSVAGSDNFYKVTCWLIDSTCNYRCSAGYDL